MQVYSITLLYCIWYGFERAIIENFRTDSLMLWGPIRVSVFVSVILFVGALIALIVIRKKQKTAVTDMDYEAMFDDGLDDITNDETPEIETADEVEDNG